MRILHAGRFRVASMTVLAIHLAMLGLEKLLAHQNFFPRLNLSHLAASALAGNLG